MSKDKKKKKPDSDTPQDSQEELLTAGNTLQKMRIEHGWHISDVSGATKISGSNLRAIENADFDSLPADTFTKGLLALYANYLGADPEQIVAQFFAERQEKLESSKRPRQKKAKPLLSTKKLAEPSHVSSAAVAGVIFLITTVLFISYCFYMSWNPLSFLTDQLNPLQPTVKDSFAGREEEDAFPAEIAAITADADISADISQVIPADSSGKDGGPQEVTELLPAKISAKVSAKEQPGKQETPSPASYTLTASFLQETKVESITDELELVEHVFKKGDQHEWQGKQSLMLIFEQSESATIQLNGKDISFPKPENGQLILRVP